MNLDVFYIPHCKPNRDPMAGVGTRSGLVSEALKDPYIEHSTKLKCVVLNTQTFQLTQRGQSNQDSAFLQLQDTYGKFKRKIIEQEILEIKPDICMLQEIDEAVKFDVSGYTRLHPTEWHGPPEQQSGCNTILLRKDNTLLHVSREAHVYPYGFEVILLVDNRRTLRVISGHFSSQSQELRLLQFRELMESSKRCGTSLLFGGDTNLRQTEVRDFTLPFTDVWDKCGTWQSKFSVNAYTNKYFHDSWMFKARYDRVYCSPDLKPLSFNLCFTSHHRELQNHYRPSGCVSDHYGIIFEVAV